MLYKINVINSLAENNPTPEWDTLPIAKLTQLGQGLEQGIFSQAAICYSPKVGILVRLWAFEVAPASSENHPYEKSALSLALAPNPKEVCNYILVSFAPNGSLLAYTVNAQGEKNPISGESLALNIFTGEDLQGEYWGGAFVIPQQLLEQRFGVKAYAGGEQAKGNILHTSRMNEVQEFSTLFAVNSGTPVIERPESFGTFEFIRF